MEKSKSAVQPLRIQEVRIKKGNIVLVFEKREILLDSQTYLNGYFYPGKELSKSEFSQLLEEEKLHKARRYLSALLTKGRYTYQQVYNKLKTKFSLPETKLRNLLLPYLEQNIINDKDYVFDFIQDRTQKGYGPKAIEMQLIQKGISKDLLKEEEILSLLNDGEDKIPDLLKRIDKSKQDLILEKKKEYMRSFLLRKGFSVEVTNEAIRSYFQSREDKLVEAEEEKKSTLLKKEALKCYNSIQKKNITPAQIKEKIKRKLLQKGFRYDEINHLLESEDHNIYD